MPNTEIRHIRHDLVQGDLARLMRYHGNVGELLLTAYFTNQPDIAKQKKFVEWIETINNKIVALN